MYCWLFIVNFPTAQCQELYPSCDYTLPTSLHRLYVSSGKEGIWYIFYPQVKKPVSFWLVKKQLWISSVEWLIHHVFQWKHQQIIIHWNLYYAETLGECCSVHLIQSVRLIQVSIDNVIWGVECHSNEQWKCLEYSQRLWHYTVYLH